METKCIFHVNTAKKNLETKDPIITNNHVNKHKGKTYCHLCSKTLSTVSNLKAHMAQVHQQMSVNE